MNALFLFSSSKNFLPFFPPSLFSRIYHPNITPIAIKKYVKVTNAYE